jgi:FKBP-type peptidyl-prolyl cis-trans isomerase SlyD
MSSQSESNSESNPDHTDRNGADMIIGHNSVVSLDVLLTDLWGEFSQKTDTPVQYLHGGYGDIFPVVEAALEGKTAGASVTLRLEPEDAYGDYNEQWLRIEPRSKFPEGIEPGMRIEAEPQADAHDEANTPRIFTVTDVEADVVVLDANHPLAGMALNFSCTVLGVRPATQDEIDNASADDLDNLILRPLP